MTFTIKCVHETSDSKGTKVLIHRILMNDIDIKLLFLIEKMCHKSFVKFVNSGINFQSFPSSFMGPLKKIYFDFDFEQKRFYNAQMHLKYNTLP